MVEFIGKFAMCSKEKLVDVLGEADVLAQQIPVIWNATHDHVPLQYLVAVHDKTVRAHKSFTFRKGKGTKVYLPCQPVVKSTVVVNDLLDHPRCRRSADDQHNVISGGRPAIPEMVKRPHKIRPRRIHPWTFVKKYDLASLSLPHKKFLQEIERLVPVRWTFASWISLSSK